MATGNDPTGPSRAPVLYDFCSKVREYASSKPDAPLGMSDSGELMSENEFNHKYGATDGWVGWGVSKFRTVKDSQGRTFKQYQDKLGIYLNEQASSTRLGDRGITIADDLRLHWKWFKTSDL